MNSTKLWLATRRKWVKLNPPNHQGYYTCAICGKWVSANNMEVDHILPRSNRPDLRFTLENLQATCYTCNRKKGSKKGKLNEINNKSK